MKYTPKELKRQGNGFTFNASDFLETVLPAGWSEKRLLSVKNDIVGETNLLTQTLGNMVNLGFRKKKEVKDTIKDFAKKYGTGLSDTEKSTKLPHGQNLLRNRVENDLLYQNATKVEEKWKGRKFMWLPSDAKEARHEHMLRYGVVYKVGDPRLPEDDNFPGKAFGCKCGYRWLEEAPPEVPYLPEELTNYMSDMGTLSSSEMDKKHPSKIAMFAAFNAMFKNRKDDVKAIKDFIVHNKSITEQIISGNVEKKYKETVNIISNPNKYFRVGTSTTLYRGANLSEEMKNMKIGDSFTSAVPTFMAEDKYSALSRASSKSSPVLYEIKLNRNSRFIPTLFFESDKNSTLEGFAAPLNSYKKVSMEVIKDNILNIKYTLIRLEYVNGLFKKIQI